MLDEITRSAAARQDDVARRALDVQREQLAEERGVTEDIVNQGEGLVGEAPRQFNDNGHPS